MSRSRDTVEATALAENDRSPRPAAPESLYVRESSNSSLVSHPEFDSRTAAPIDRGAAHAGEESDDSGRSGHDHAAPELYELLAQQHNPLDHKIFKLLNRTTKKRDYGLNRVSEPTWGLFRPRIGNVDALRAVPSWNYKSEDDGVKHIGPVSQDFHALFGLGHDDKTISTVDPSGIALVTIQELKRQNDRMADELKLLRERLARLEVEGQYKRAGP